ncbi:hypothetical protein E2C01_012760 [Portunus trituberculatus]|uniref:Uncharacterized protein n=1 Tax=Portunus trituberculatus TaxID=210409 RepID=A0A5B7DEJ4_PORTR|nr:hypothetical protein [Portunus trituberculatus]
MSEVSVLAGWRNTGRGREGEQREDKSGLGCCLRYLFETTRGYDTLGRVAGVGYTAPAPQPRPYSPPPTGNSTGLIIEVDRTDETHTAFD